MRYTFHYIAMPHLPVTKEYQACAFTQKIHKLTRMLLAKGHRVFLYGVDRTDIKHENLSFVPVLSIRDVVDAWGEGDNRFELGYDWQKKGFKHDITSQPTKATQKFRFNAIKEITRRKKENHFLLLSQGMYQKSIADAVDLFLTCEPGIGYRGSYAQFRAFESAYIQNFTYGSEHPRESINGAYYHRVIPNYFDLEDFTFNPQPKDYLFYIGRLIPRKGVETAMRVADALEMPLFVAGQGSLSDIPYKSDRVTHIGTLNANQRNKWLGEALVTLAPTRYLEPFGGVTIESMLTGTPVVTTNFGVFPETIKNGVAGYRCDTLQDFVHKTKKAIKLDRLTVRTHGVKYSMENINKMYEKWWTELYQVWESVKDPSKKAWHRIK